MKTVLLRLPPQRPRTLRLPRAVPHTPADYSTIPLDERKRRVEPLLGEPRHEYNTDEDGQPEEEWKANPIDLILNAIDAVLPDDQDFDTQVTSYLIRAAAYRYLGQEERELDELRSLTRLWFTEDGHGADRLRVPRSTVLCLLNPYPGLRWYDYEVTQG